MSLFSFSFSLFILAGTNASSQSTTRSLCNFRAVYLVKDTYFKMSLPVDNAMNPFTKLAPEIIFMILKHVTGEDEDPNCWYYSPARSPIYAPPAPIGSAYHLLGRSQLEKTRGCGPLTQKKLVAISQTCKFLRKACIDFGAQSHFQILTDRDDILRHDFTRLSLKTSGLGIVSKVRYVITDSLPNAITSIPMVPEDISQY